MSDTTQCLLATKSFLGLLQQMQVFLKNSHKLFHVYLKQNQKVLLSATGVTRWRSTSDGTTKRFGHFDYWVGTENTDNTFHQRTVFVELVVTLYMIGNSQDFNPKTPLSDYLQTKKLDYAQAWGLVSTSQNELEEAKSQFDQVIRAAIMFVSVMSRLLDEKIEGNPSLEAENLYMELELQSKKIRKITEM
ncbi:hypothetical protein PR048_008784 [Dryococelus australis]|uniref:Uncharacterized protein n=1 Tax=Dryococelus australis TaxID=614101 RepID=A0ABQ9HY34_9NEOP|nr:hypothetical protein PR048_008784 [Dryococelus australis]